MMRFKLPYRTGTFLAASILIATATMYTGVTLPTLPGRFDGFLESPGRLVLAIHDLEIWLAHVGMLYCGVALLFRKISCVPWALFLVGLMWLSNVTIQLALSEYELLLPTTFFALFVGLPLVWTWRTASRRAFASNGARRYKPWLQAGEALFAIVILVMATSVAVVLPLGALLSRPSVPESPRIQGPVEEVSRTDPQRV